MHKRRNAKGIRKFVVVAAAAIIPALGVALPASAGAATTAPGPSSNFQFSVEPYAAPGTQQRSNFSYELQPGHSILDQMAVLNSSSNPESFAVYPEDATNVKGTGGFAFQEQGHTHNTGVGKWLSVGQTLFTVPAGKQVIDTFQLSVPADAPPGDHVGAIVVQQLHSPGQPPSKEGLNLVLRFAVPMFVRVVGPVRPGVTIENVTVFHDSPMIPYVSGTPKTAVRFTLVNTGNVILLPKTATVSISALIGGTIHSYTVHRQVGKQSRTNPLPAQLLPGGQMVLTELWSGVPPFDPLTAHVSILAKDPTSSLPVVTASSTTFWYFPWIPLVIVIALIVGFVLWRRWRRHKRENSSGMPSTSPEGAAETSIAESAASVSSVDESIEEVGV